MNLILASLRKTLKKLELLKFRKCCFLYSHIDICHGKVPKPDVTAITDVVAMSRKGLKVAKTIVVLYVFLTPPTLP